MEIGAMRGVYIGVHENLRGEVATLEEREDGLYACFDDVRTGMNIDMHGPFAADQFDVSPEAVETAEQENPSFTA